MKLLHLVHTFGYYNEESNDLIKDCLSDLKTPLNIVTIEEIEDFHISGTISLYRWAQSAEELKHIIDHFSDDLVGECYTIYDLFGKQLLTEE